MAKKVEIFTMEVCPYCVQAKNLMDRHDIAYEEVRIDQIENGRELVIEKTGGLRTVPQILVDGEHIGDENALFKMERDGTLKENLVG
ncbi:MAG: glutaredoxin domain-containing protein [Alphaproteobacteria bacterium]|jgi:glutaredoxin 3|nr:glutaredoxin domain-containing protein [Alphaproteobacteria bacterium]MDP7222744.1 glutaredoxin domain-containing protein [Alphaproteobacteria bacterium]